MNARRLVDTNVIVRHLTQDHEIHSRLADRLFAACDRNELILVLLPAVLAECIYVLESFYGYPRHRIAQLMTVLVSSPAIECDDLIQLDALKHYQSSNLAFVDCLLAATAIASGLPVASFDKGLAKLVQVSIHP